jgi:hypothetical protein
MNDNDDGPTCHPDEECSDCGRCIECEHCKLCEECECQDNECEDE